MTGQERGQYGAGPPIHGGETWQDGERVSLPDRFNPETRPGQGVVVMLGLAIGLLLMVLQLWLLTLAFDLFLAGKRADTVVVALVSGLVFLGGLMMLALVERGPKRRS